MGRIHISIALQPAPFHHYYCKHTKYVLPGDGINIIIVILYGSIRINISLCTKDVNILTI